MEYVRRQKQMRWLQEYEDRQAWRSTGRRLHREGCVFLQDRKKCMCRAYKYPCLASSAPTCEPCDDEGSDGDGEEEEARPCPSRKQPRRAPVRDPLLEAMLEAMTSERDDLDWDPFCQN